MMHPGKFLGLIATATVAACAAPSGQSVDLDRTIIGRAETNSAAQSAATVQRSEAPAASVAELPSDACTREGYWSFFEAFVQSPEIRQAYTDDGAKEAINPFRISLVDHQWAYTGTDGQPAPEALSLKESLNGNSFKVEYVRAEFNEDDEVVSTYGKKSAYEFQLKNGCWRLTKAIE